jgi:uncharacterized protein (DUF2236 family)
MTVTTEDFEARIAEVVRNVRDPRAGIYGPASISWRVNREAVIMLGGGRAALLQLAHPYVAYAVDQHSKTRHDPIGRFKRTFENVFAMVFGDLDSAISCARRVHAIHTRIKGPIREAIGPYADGHRYQANTEDALFWVHATLLDTALHVHELLVAPLTLREKEEYYAESRLFAGLFGIPDHAMPARYADFTRYMDTMLASDVISVSQPGREMAGFLFQPPRPIHGPGVGWYKAFTASLLPPRLRAEFGLPWGEREEKLTARTIPMLRLAQRNAPKRLRYFPDYVEARRRVRGDAPRDPVGRFLEKLALRAIEPPARSVPQRVRSAG